MCVINRAEILKEDDEELKLDLDSPIGEKPWPLRLAIPAILKDIGKIYVSVCTVAVSIFIILAIMTHLDWIYGFRSILK